MVTRTGCSLGDQKTQTSKPDIEPRTVRDVGVERCDSMHAAYDVDNAARKHLFCSVATLSSTISQQHRGRPVYKNVCTIRTDLRCSSDAVFPYVFDE